MLGVYYIMAWIIVGKSMDKLSLREMCNHEHAWLAHQGTFGEKIARFNISQLYVIKINHRVQMITDIAEVTPIGLFFAIQPLSQSQNTTVFMIKTSLEAINARPPII